MNEKQQGPLAIAARQLTKVYRLYDNVRDQAIDVMGLSRLFFWRKIQSREFLALNGLDIEIAHGERVGIIGENGAGKTTFLKLITGAISPTGGQLDINGEIQALMQVGLGFHPEFTGRENIEASLLYSGLDAQDKTTAERDIIEFCELGQFLDQPLKTYSLGMQSRLQFACATAVKPDILVVDEILGAGDAYFSMKSSERMEKLTGSGCTLLLVSHSMGQVLQFCERVLWFRDGRVEMDGPALQVVKAYEQWMHEKSLGAGLKAVRVAPERGAVSGDEVLSVDEGGASESEESSDRQSLADQETDELPPPASSFDESARWRTEDTPLEIFSVALLDRELKPVTTIEPDGTLIIQVSIKALREGQFPCAFAINIYAANGHSAVWAGSEVSEIDARKNDVFDIRLVLDPLMLNSGVYSISTAVFDQINRVNKSAAYRYDLVSRSFEFTVLDAHDGNGAMFRHPCNWGELKKR